jgi:hypothetical protein
VCLLKELFSRGGTHVEKRTPFTGGVMARSGTYAGSSGPVKGVDGEEWVPHDGDD